MKCVIDEIVSGNHDWKLRLEITDVKLIRACVSCMASWGEEEVLMNGYALTAHCYGNQCFAVYVNTLTSGHVERRDCSPMRC
jgi:hypothetical protein